MHDDSHIDYLMISESSSGAVRAFGIHAEPNLCDNRGGRHAALFADVDVVAVLRLSDEAVPVTPPKRTSQIKYSDKKRVGRFREYADVLFEKRGVDEMLNVLIGDIVLDDELQGDSERDWDEEMSRGWGEVHWRPPHARATTAAGVEGGRAADDGGGDEQRPYGRNGRAGAGTRAQGDTEHNVRMATESGEGGARQRHVTTTDEPALRRRIDGAMAVLDKLSHDAGFSNTHGGRVTQAGLVKREPMGQRVLG